MGQGQKSFCTKHLLLVMNTCINYGADRISSTDGRMDALDNGGAWWRHQMETFSALLTICAGNSPVPVNSQHKGQWHGAFMLSFISAWINGWVNNREAGDLRRNRTHYDVNVMGLMGCIRSLMWACGLQWLEVRGVQPRSRSRSFYFWCSASNVSPSQLSVNESFLYFVDMLFPTIMCKTPYI